MLSHCDHYVAPLQDQRRIAKCGIGCANPTLDCMQGLIVAHPVFGASIRAWDKCGSIRWIVLSGA